MTELLFIGGGKMATAIAGGIVKAGVFSAGKIKAFDVNAQSAKNFSEATGIECLTNSVENLIQESKIVLVAVKPQTITQALQPYNELLKSKLILSIAAGVTLETLFNLTGSERIVRIMPNTPALFGYGAAGFSPSSKTSLEDVAIAEKILSATGLAIKLKEADLDAVTALSGSGPAYVFEFIQSLADGGVAEGLSRETALQLAAQTVLGSAIMVLESGEHPDVLKDKVTSPAGTTSRALEVLAERGFSGTVMQAVRAAAHRSRELGKN